jgi:exodeoxyribonuclease V beta subunit
MTTTAKTFDLLNAPLEGTNLIEASAGTGKTYTISGLYVRLVVEKGFGAGEILVVTFTEAATEELKGRIRTKLREAWQALSEGKSPDAFLDGLARRYRRSSGGALRHVEEVLRGFDQAAIFTIHGFCRRILHENAFESGSLFDTELVADQEGLKEAIIEDFWRRHFYRGSRLFVHYAMHKKFTPANLLSLVGNRTGQPYLRIIPRMEPPDASLEEENFRVAFDEARQVWMASKEEVRRILCCDERLNRSKYRKISVDAWLHRMDDYLSHKANGPFLFAGFEKFTAAELEQGVKKGCSPPVHPFFEVCERLKERQEELDGALGKRLLWLKGELFHYVQKELVRRKEAQNIQSFDDLLLKLHGALGKKRGGILARAVRRRFPAALIDEFQDTDPVQYAIFKRIFHNRKSVLFLIGDPKQAIYSFRGADIFTYMDAANHVESQYTLRENWRSEPGLVTAVNTLFSRAEQPFLYERIPFRPVAPAKGLISEPLRIERKPQSPFLLWFFYEAVLPGADKPISKKLARVKIPKAVAAEISRLLLLAKDRKVLLGKRPLRENDIAVLVRKNAEARLMQEALSALHVPSVLHTTGSLFDSHEAMEMERVLAAIAESEDERTLRGALATDLLGLTGEDICSLAADEEAWERWILRFRRYRDLWNEKGFVGMFRRLLMEEEVLPRLMAFPDGERRNTNVLHLSEVLHQASVGRKLGTGGLVKWLSERRDASTPRLDEHQLRLETDERAVRLVTIHKSKGLEYPVVFCPFSWEGTRVGGEEGPFVYHDEDRNMQPTLDLGSHEVDKNRRVAEKEELAEEMRLLYVALTRAKSRCYFVWGRFRDAETSAPAYLLHHPKAKENGGVVTTLQERFLGLNAQRLLEELKILEEESCGAVRLADIPKGPGGPCPPVHEAEGGYAFRQFSGNIDRSWGFASYSSLVSGRPQRADLADRDWDLPGSLAEDMAEEAATAEPSGIFAFPKGVRAGIFMHDVMEHYDFAQEAASRREALVEEKLKEYGFDLTWKDCLCSMLERVCSVPLEPSRGGFALSSVTWADRLNELEFTFPLRSISSQQLQALFEGNGGTPLKGGFPERVGALHFSPARGFMKGFIDLVFRFEERFFLVDWKSNYLGPRVTDYGQEALCEVMEEDFYILQYHIYALALHHYLRLRVPGYAYETHFGGIYYVFLRGVAPEQGPDFGIYRDRPSTEFLDALSVSLTGVHVT